MTDFGTPEERAAALRVAEACMALNNAISNAVDASDGSYHQYWFGAINESAVA